MGEAAIKVAIVHDWLVADAGAEKVLKEIVALFPHADIFALVDFLSEEQRGQIIEGKKVHTSFIQHLPFARRHFRNYLPLFPKAIESLDLRDYDLVISSSWAFAKGVRTTPSQKHICYCHTPIRYAWDLYDEYISDLKQPKRWVVERVLQRIREWDKQKIPDLFIANSTEVARRIGRIYHQDSIIIHPPVDCDRFGLCAQKEDYYLTLSRLVPYKKTRLIVQAFARMPQRRLKVVGSGEELEKLRQIATPNVEILGFQPDSKVVDLMQRAKAFIYAAYEDFGIVMAEALSCGTPVIAYAKGGALDIVKDGCGILFHEQTPEAIVESVKRFERSCFKPEELRKQALRFDRSRFRAKFSKVVDEVFQKGDSPHTLSR